MAFEHFQNLFDFGDSINGFTQLFKMSPNVIVGHIQGSIAWVLTIPRLLVSAKLFGSIQLIVVIGG
jgi:hypothetical protein